MNKDKQLEYLRKRKAELRGPGGCSVLHETIHSEKVNLLNEIIMHIQSEPEETCITLPCKVGDTVYTIEKDNSPCEKCEHGEEVGYNVSACLLSHRDYECPSPEYYIEDHKVEGFEIGSGGIELVEEWGYDSKHIYEPYYLTREAAEAALSNEKAGE